MFRVGGAIWSYQNGDLDKFVKDLISDGLHLQLHRLTLEFVNHNVNISKCKEQVKL